MKEQRVIVITGGSSGMGRAIAQKFAETGDVVYILGRNQERLDRVVAANTGIRAIVADVGNAEAVVRAQQEITNQSKVIDVLINCAGITASAPEGDLAGELNTWQEVIQTNLTGTFLATHVFQPYLKRPGGRIISITSVAAFSGSSRASVGGQAYAASKAAIHGLTRTLVKSLAAEGITINCIAPGVVDNTAFFGGTGISEDRRADYIKGIPVGRLGGPEEIAEAAFYLASKEASFITGEILNINGGAQFGR